MTESKYIFRYWLTGSVFLAVFPFLSIIIIDIITGYNINWARMFGNGEAVLSSFLIVSPSLVSNYQYRIRENIDKKVRDKGEKLFLILLVITIMLLVTYITIKTVDTVDIGRIYIASISSGLVSLFVSWGNETYLQDIV